MKNADFKIRSFLKKNRGFTPWQIVDFWTKIKYSFICFQLNQYVRKRLLRPCFSSFKGPGTKKLRLNKDKRENSFNFFVRPLFAPKMISKGVSRHAEIPRDIKEGKMPNSIFSHIL